MEEDRNTLLQTLKENIFKLEQNIFESFGMKLYKKINGYTPEDIYNLCGREDSVATITLKDQSEGYFDFGEDLTVCFVYTPKERQMLESDASSLNAFPYVKAKILLPCYEQSVSDKLLTRGVNSQDIIQIIVAPTLKHENTYNSKAKRSSHSIEIPFEPYGNGNDITWEYGFLIRCKNAGVALSYDEYVEYLAYKIVLDKNGMTEEEYRTVFDDHELIHNPDVAWHFLNWKKDASLLTEKDKKNLNYLTFNRMVARLHKLDEQLKGVGGLVAFANKHNEKAKLIVDKVLRFRQRRYNIQGKHLLYMDLDGFLHIYLRHVEELNANGLYPAKTKFQLNEKDVEIVIRNIMCALNEEYQAFRDTNPNGQFRKYSDQAYYYKGDYYVVRVEADGRLTQFYKMETL